MTLYDWLITIVGMTIAILIAVCAFIGAIEIGVIITPYLRSGNGQQFTYTARCGHADSTWSIENLAANAESLHGLLCRSCVDRGVIPDSAYYRYSICDKLFHRYDNLDSVKVELLPWYGGDHRNRGYRMEGIVVPKRPCPVCAKEARAKPQQSVILFKPRGN